MTDLSLREELAERIRAVIGEDPNVTEKKMFGGIAFMLNGNMLVGPHKDGSMMVRVGKDLEAEARSRPHSRAMDFTGKPMAGFVTVDPPGLESDADLAGWIALATQFVGALPAK